MDINSQGEIQKFVDNPLFSTVFAQLREEIASDMLKATVEEFVTLKAEASALSRLQEKLVEIANNVRMAHAGRSF